MERLAAYTVPMPDGGVNVDVEGMLVDLVTVFKACGCPHPQFIGMCADVWNDVIVDVKIPDRNKN